MSDFTTTATIGKRELAITFDGESIAIECLCGMPIELGSKRHDQRYCRECGSLWRSSTSLHELVGPDYAEFCYCEITVWLDHRDDPLVVMSNEAEAAAMFNERYGVSPS